MALTLPFINSISAFDATKGTTINLNVLGGDAITGYQFFIYNVNDDSLPIYSSANIAVQNDIAGESIRTFPIQLNQSLGIMNNNSYKIQTRIFNNTDSLYGNFTDFLCYATPDIILQYKTLIETEPTFVDLEENSVIPSSTIQMQALFYPQEINSKAQPNYLNVKLYGVQGGQQVYIGETGNLYNFSSSLDGDQEIYTTSFDLSGFSINLDKNNQGSYIPKADSLYSSFIVGYECMTIEGMLIQGEISSIDCFYNVLLHSPYLKLQNLCNKGVIQITCEGLTSLQGTSNPPEDDLTFIDGQELDLTESGTWVQWQRYFSLQQPYTVRIWARDLQDGVILNMTSTTNSGAYITLTKESANLWDEDSDDYVDYTYISLKSGLSEGFPYYLESDKIETSEIDSSTKLFICLQAQDGLFELSLDIIND